MIFPIILWLGGIVCLVLQIFLQVVHIHNPDFGPYQWAAVNMHVGPGIALTPFWASTTALNAYCTGKFAERLSVYKLTLVTGLLIWRIRRVSNKGDVPFVKKLQFLIRVLMESGILYLSVGLAHLFAWFGTSSFAVSLLGTMVSLLLGLLFEVSKVD